MTIHRLENSICYLVGPMDHKRDAGRQWRLDIGKWLKERHIIPLNPYEKPVYSLHDNSLEDDDAFDRRQQAKARGDWQAVSDIMKPVVGIDLRMVDKADFLLCYADIDNKPCGTYDEVFTATEQNKPVVVMAPQGIKTLPDWMFGRLKWQMFFEDWDKLKEYIRHIDEDEEIDTLNRWKFFDLKKYYTDIVLCNIASQS